MSFISKTTRSIEIENLFHIQIRSESYNRHSKFSPEDIHCTAQSVFVPLNDIQIPELVMERKYNASFEKNNFEQFIGNSVRHMVSL